MFQKVLIANRGEIAVRLMRTCRALGVRTVAVYSQADRAALHVRVADEAVAIGPAPAAQSYLRIERLLDAARKTGAQAVHPGYGFLAENASFARAVEEAGLVWIGPPPEAMERMGDKVAARQLAEAAGVPLVPGSPPLHDPHEAATWADKLGYPVLLKAAAGGGGKGMRLVRGPQELEPAFARARSEAERSFGDGTLYLEKAITHAKHIEMQIFSDAAGHHLWLGERECTIQRRHQKLIEESPSTALTASQRERMGEAAVALAAACGYRNAGTVEFLYDVDAQAFYFLEMNTRLQVEHPVTEAVTGLDLVAWQLRVAAGEPLPTDHIERRGVALECRLYAEDPVDCLPATGRLWVYRPPEGIRLDGGVQAGDVVGSFYDPLLAKLIAHGPDRAEAIRKMRAALDRFALAGVVTNLALHRAVLDDPVFQAGEHLTDFLEKKPQVEPTDHEIRALACLAAALVRAREERLYRALAEETAFSQESRVGRPPWVVSLGPHARRLQALPALDELGAVDLGQGVWQLEVAGRPVVTVSQPEAEGLVLWWQGRPYPVRLEPLAHHALRDRFRPAQDPSQDGQVLQAHMPGLITQVRVVEGQPVQRGDGLLVIEAMKMENELLAPISGVIQQLRAVEGQQVNKGDTLCVIRAQSET